MKFLVQKFPSNQSQNPVLTLMCLALHVPQPVLALPMLTMTLQKEFKSTQSPMKERHPQKIVFQFPFYDLGFAQLTAKAAMDK